MEVKQAVQDTPRAHTHMHMPPTQRARSELACSHPLRKRGRGDTRCKEWESIGSPHATIPGAWVEGRGMQQGPRRTLAFRLATRQGTTPAATMPFTAASEVAMAIRDRVAFNCRVALPAHHKTQQSTRMGQGVGRTVAVRDRSAGQGNTHAAELVRE
jgi:hypothetical protein